MVGLKNLLSALVAHGISSGTVLRLEGLCVLFGIVVAYWAANCRIQFLDTFENWMRALSRRRSSAIAISGLLPVLLRLALLPVLNVPEPAVQEEFSNLLQADTFAQGKLSNPPHPMADFFETFQVLQRPTYCSIRPPGQGAFLAVGEVLFNSSWAGVILSVGTLCASLCWMLQAWVPPPWAFLGAILAGLRVGVLGYWMNSYWGGAVTALGGVLVVGALPRLKEKADATAILAFCIGLIVIVTTRIYEGLFILIPVTVSLISWARTGVSSDKAKLRVLVVIILVGISFSGWLSYFNLRTTGNPTLPPYALYISKYNPAPPFIWQKLQTRRFSIPEMNKFYIDWSIPYFERMTGRHTYLAALLTKLEDLWDFYFRWAFVPPLCVMLLLFSTRRFTLLWGILATAAIGAMIEVWGAPYYFAALLGVWYVLLMEGLRRLKRSCFRARPMGTFISRWVVATCCLIFLFSVFLQVVGIRIKDAGLYFFSPGLNPLHERAAVENRLERMDGQHLVIVRYSARHDPHQEWVWNRSDPDLAKIVWARDLGVQKEKTLLQYYAARSVWLVEPDNAKDGDLLYRLGSNYKQAPR